MPDRWLVVRVQAGATQTAPRVASAWVVSGALDPGRRRAVPLADWREDRANAAPAVTAMGPGEPTFAVYYDNTRNLLAFHDPLTGVSAGPLSYTVCGWYARLEDDPLYAPTTEAAWLAVLAQRGWAVDEDVVRSLRRKGKGERYKHVLKAADTQEPAGGLKVGADSVASQAEPVKLQIGTGAAQFVQHQSIKGIKGQAIYGQQSFFEPYWPRQLLCHGAVFDVRWGGRGGGFDHPGAGVPTAGSVGLAVGNTASQALAALSARQSGDASLARLLDAFATGAIGELSQPSGLARLESTLHAEDLSLIHI